MGIPSDSLQLESRDQSDDQSSTDVDDSPSSLIDKMALPLEELGRTATSQGEYVKASSSTTSSTTSSKAPNTSRGKRTDNSVEEVRLLLEIKKKYEAEMEKYAEQITTFKETIMQMREENNLLRNQIRIFKLDSHGKLVDDLEEEVKKWETLYTETAEMGARRVSRLEEELEQLKASTKSSEAAAEHAKEHTKNLCKALKATFKSAKTAREELDEYREKSMERESLLKDMVEKAHADKERELEILKSKQEKDQAKLLEKIEDLEADLKAKVAIIERERNQSSKREARLKEQIRKLQPSSETDSVSTSRIPRGGVFDNAFATVSKVLDGGLCLCSAEG